LGLVGWLVGYWLVGWDGQTNLVGWDGPNLFGWDGWLVIGWDGRLTHDKLSGVICERQYPQEIHK
jgi:hypothetical protein